MIWNPRLRNGALVCRTPSLYQPVQEEVPASGVPNQPVQEEHGNDASAAVETEPKDVHIDVTFPDGTLNITGDDFDEDDVFPSAESDVVFLENPIRAAYAAACRYKPVTYATERGMVEMLPNLEVVAEEGPQEELDNEEHGMFVQLYGDHRIRHCLSLATGRDVVHEATFGDDGIEPAATYLDRIEYDVELYRADLREVWEIARYGHLVNEPAEACESKVRELAIAKGVTCNSALANEITEYRKTRRRAALEVVIVHFFQTHRIVPGYSVPQGALADLALSASDVLSEPAQKYVPGSASNVGANPSSSAGTSS